MFFQWWAHQIVSRILKLRTYTFFLKLTLWCYPMHTNHIYLMSLHFYWYENPSIYLIFFLRFVVPLVAYVTRDWKTQFQVLSSLAIFAPLLMNYVPGKLPSRYFSIQITLVVQNILCIKNLWEGVAMVNAVNNRRCIFTFDRSRRRNTWKDLTSDQIE